MSQAIFGLKLTTRLWIVSLFLSILFGFSLWLIKVNHKELFLNWSPIFLLFLTLVGTSISLFGIVLFQKIIEKFSHESKDNESFTDLRLTEMPNVVYIPTEIPNVFYLQPGSIQESMHFLPSYGEVMLQQKNKKNFEFPSKNCEIDGTPPPSYDEVMFMIPVTQN